MDDKKKEGTRHHSENPGRPTDSTSRGNDNYERGAPEKKKVNLRRRFFLFENSMQIKFALSQIGERERVFGRKEGRGRERKGWGGEERRTEVDNSTQGNISKTGRTVIKNSSSSLPIYP